MTEEDKPVCSRKYQTTKTNYNSNVYDLYGDYDSLPSNHTLPLQDDFQTIINRSLPATKKGYFKLKSNRPDNDLNIIDTAYLSYTKLYNLYDYDYFNKINVLSKDKDGYIVNELTTNPEITISLTEKPSKIVVDSANINYIIGQANTTGVNTFTTEYDISTLTGNNVTLQLVIGEHATFNNIKVQGEIIEQL